jgi:hypothetical protein
MLGKRCTKPISKLSCSHLCRDRALNVVVLASDTMTAETMDEVAMTAGNKIFPDDVPGAVVSATKYQYDDYEKRKTHPVV